MALAPAPASSTAAPGPRVAAPLPPLPLQRSPEFGPGSNLDELLAEQDTILGRTPPRRRVAASGDELSSNASSQDLCIGVPVRDGLDLLDVLEARDLAAKEGAAPGASPAVGSRSIEF